MIYQMLYSFIANKTKIKLKFPHCISSFQSGNKLNEMHNMIGCTDHVEQIASKLLVTCPSWDSSVLLIRLKVTFLSLNSNVVLPLYIYIYIYIYTKQALCLPA